MDWARRTGITYICYEMKNRFFICRKDKFLKLLLAATVLCSIFAFLPSIDNWKHHQQNTQTESFYVFTKNSLAKTIAYKNINTPVDKSNTINNFYIRQTTSLLNYNRTILVQLVKISTQYIEFKSTPNFVQLKIIPKNSDEDNFISITG